MDNAVLKFISYLKEQFEQTLANILFLDSQKNKSTEELEHCANLEKKFIVLGSFIRIFETPKSMWSKCSQLFNDFHILSEYLESSPLNAKESMDIIFYLIIKNLSTNLLENSSFIVDSIALENYHFKKITKEEVEKIVYADGIRTLMEKSATDLTAEDEEKQQEILEFVEKHGINIESIIKQHQIIQTHYLDKKTYFTKEDIESVVDALKNLKVSKILINKIEKVLTQKYQKRMQRLMFQNISFHLDAQNTSQEKLLTDKEYKKIKKELNTYYDFRNGLLLHALSFEEIIYCITLLLRLGESQSEIENFLMKAELSHNQHQTDPLEKIAEELEKFKFYKGICDIEQDLQNLELSLEEVNQAKTIEEQSFWKSLCLEELRKIKTTISQTKSCSQYDYEIDCAKKLLKKKKEEKSLKNE